MQISNGRKTAIALPDQEKTRSPFPHSEKRDRL
jgi:hypothetical protein